MTDNAELKKLTPDELRNAQGYASMLRAGLIPETADNAIDVGNCMHSLLTALSESEAAYQELADKYYDTAGRKDVLEAEAKRLREHDAWATVRLRRVEKAAKMVHEDTSLTRLAEMERVLFGPDDSGAEAEYISAALNKEVEGE